MTFETIETLAVQYALLTIDGDDISNTQWYKSIGLLQAMERDHPPHVVRAHIKQARQSLAVCGVDSLGQYP
jgi:hypothetical protein